MKNAQSTPSKALICSQPLFGKSLCLKLQFWMNWCCRRRRHRHRRRSSISFPHLECNRASIQLFKVRQIYAFLHFRKEIEGQRKKSMEIIVKIDINIDKLLIANQTHAKILMETNLFANTNQNKNLQIQSEDLQMRCSACTRIPIECVQKIKFQTKCAINSYLLLWLLIQCLINSRNNWAHKPKKKHVGKKNPTNCKSSVCERKANWMEKKH